MRCGRGRQAIVFLAGLQHLAKQPLADNAINLGSITPRQLEDSRRFFGEMERLFPRELRWVAQSDGQVALGSNPSLTSRPPTPSPLRSGARAVAQDRRHNLAPGMERGPRCAGQDRVEVVPDRGAENRLTLWIYPLEDGKVAVDTQVDLRLPVTLAPGSTRS